MINSPHFVRIKCGLFLPYFGETYYFDGDWREDYQAYEDGKIPEDMPCGVLSEDLVFNASTGHHGLAIEYLKVVAKVLDQTKD